MTTVGALLLLLGALFIIGGLVALALRFSDQRLLRRLQSASQLTCGALTAQGLPRLVLITGETVAGPEGLLRSPAYDVPCLWFRTDVIAVDAENTAPHEAVRHGVRAVFRRAGGGPIRIGDETGSVQLDDKLARPGGAADPVITERRGEEGKLSRVRESEVRAGMDRLMQTGLLPASASGVIMRRTLDLREEFVQPGRKVTVLGRPRRVRGGGVVLRRPGAMHLEEPDAWITRLEADIGGSAVVLKLIPIGGVLIAVGVLFGLVGAH